MNTVITTLQWILKMATTISVYAFKVPVWILKLIPGVSKLLENLNGYKTVVANFSVAALAWMGQINWIDIGGTVCKVVDFITGLLHLNFVCNPSWLPTIAAIFIAMLNLALRTATNQPLPDKLGFQK